MSYGQTKSSTGQSRRKRHLNPLPTISTPQLKGKELGKQQERSGSDQIRPYPDQSSSALTWLESQIGRVKYRGGEDTQVTPELKNLKTARE